MEIINATPHPIVLFGADCPDTLASTDAPAPLVTYAPSGTLARAAQTRADVGVLNGVPVGASSFGEVEGLPAPAPGVWYIVSGLVLAAGADRPDLLAPARPVRDEAGRVVGCRAWDTTPAGAAALSAPTPPSGGDEVPAEKWEELAQDARAVTNLYGGGPKMAAAEFEKRWPGISASTIVWTRKGMYGGFEKSLAQAAREAFDEIEALKPAPGLSVKSQSGKWGLLIDSPLPGITAGDIKRATSYGLDNILVGKRAVLAGKKGVQTVVKLVDDPASRVWVRWSQRGGKADVPAGVTEVLSMGLQSVGHIAIYNLPVADVEVVIYGYQGRTSTVKTI